MKRKPMYPGVAEAEKERKRVQREYAAGIKPAHFPQEEPDWVGDKPNWEKFRKQGVSVEQALIWLNID